MNKKLLYVLITFICFSLVGIIITQFFWIRNAFQVKEAQFSRSVKDAMGNALDKIEAIENMSYISHNYEGDSIMRIVRAFSKDTSRVMKRRLDSLIAHNEIFNSDAAVPMPPPPPKVKDMRKKSTIRHYFYNSQDPMMAMPDADSIKREWDKLMHSMETTMPVLNLEFSWDDQVALLDSLMRLNASDQNIFLNGEIIESPDPDERALIVEPKGSNIRGYYQYSIPRNFSPVPPRRPARIERNIKPVTEDNLQKLDKRAKSLKDLLKQMAIALDTKAEPIQQRINKSSLQSALNKSFLDKGIDIPFEFAVVSPASDSNHIPIKSADFNNELGQTGYKVSLFPNDLFHDPDHLLVYFPGQKTHVLKSLRWLLVVSILFTVVILLSSGTSIVVMIRQKKISDIKTDFINNMTHEFKTPIATISIAADSIANPRVLAEPERIKSLTRIIKEENNRMNTRVEQILQMALLDSRDFHLVPKLADMNYLIEKVVSHYRLQIEQREGSITTSLEAERSMLEIDEDHMRNVLLNLLDNANKYSLVKPEIEVFSFNRAGKFFFGVRDKGLGMSPETQRKVFDKFFRLTSGNIHNIKGFGLGLSYVKAIVLAHQGEIQVQSELGRGSRFEIGLPLSPEQMETENEIATF